MHVLTVGRPFPTAVPRVDAGAFYRYADGDHSLTLLMARPTPVEVEAVWKGQTRFALVVDGPALFFCYRFVPMPWSDAPYNIHLEAPEDRTPPNLAELTDETRTLLHIHLVDTESGILRALRALTLGPDFTRALFEAIRDQAAAPIPGRKAYMRHVAEVQRRFPSEALIERSLARTFGGA
jgi:hypothetical protein